MVAIGHYLSAKCYSVLIGQVAVQLYVPVMEVLRFS